MKKYVFVWMTLILCLLIPKLTGADDLPPRGSWKCTVLDPRTLVLTGDYDELQQTLFRQKSAARDTGRKLPRWAEEFNFHAAGTEAIASYRPAAVALLLNEADKITLGSSQGKPLNVVRTGIWLTPEGLARFPDKAGREKISKNADLAHHCFLELDRPLTEGEEITVTMPAGEKVEFVYRPDTPTPIFKVNQIGYMPDARKYAYLGAWLGTAGPLRLHPLAGRPFRLAEAGSGKTVFTGTLTKRPEDPVNASGTPFSGEEVLELDFTPFSAPGRYYLAVDGVGRSADFRIGSDTMAEAFYLHARGLFHQRCGIARDENCTNWTARACHPHCFRGTFPPDDSHYNKGADNRPWGFHTVDGKSLTVNHFLLIEQNAPIRAEKLEVAGGWHDAADWDRRPQHLTIVGDLTAVYLLKPENFCDGQLDLPESGNGIPDILDEALWGMEHLRKKQQPDGGVGTWVETTRHPTPDDGCAADDTLVYYLSCATRNSTLEYAAYAAELALALKRAGAEEKAAEYIESAEKAWTFAFQEGRPPVRAYRYNRRTIFYREDPELAPELIVKAGLDLYLLKKDESYLHAAEDAAVRAEAVMKKNAWRWSPFFWIELELGSYDSIVLDKLREARRRPLLRDAEAMLRQQEENYPYRIAWFGPKDAWVHTMSWGTYHPLRRARTFVAAHAMTGAPEFRKAAMIANDFHNGANPSGSAMTSGLGRVYPVRFLDLNSYADGIAEFVPGITPFRNTYGIPRAAVKMAYGLFYPPRAHQNFSGYSISLLPKPGHSENECAQEIGRILPIWRRWCNVEGESVDASEFSVWETIAPAAAVTGYLLGKADKPDPEWKKRKPAGDIRTLPGWHALP